MTDAAKLIRAHGGRVTARQLMQARRQYRGSADLAKADLDDLTGAGFGRWIDIAPSDKGGRPSRVFELFDRPGGNKTPTDGGENRVSLPLPRATVGDDMPPGDADDRLPPPTDADVPADLDAEVVSPW